MVSRAMQTCKVIIALLILLLCSDLAFAAYDSAKISVNLSGARAWYVNSSSGSDSNTGISEGQAFATIQKALDSCANSADSIGHEVIWLKGSFDLTTSLVCTKTGDATNFKWLVGYENTINDNGVATITDLGDLGNISKLIDVGSNYGYGFINLDLTVSGSASYGIYCTGNYSVNYLANTRVRAGANAVYCNKWTDFRVDNCYLESTNEQYAGSDVLSGIFYGCTIKSPWTESYPQGLSSYCIYIRCLLIGASRGVAYSNHRIYDCTLYNYSQYGLYINPGYPVHIVNSIFYGDGGGCIAFNDVTLLMGGNNLFYNNTTNIKFISKQNADNVLGNSDSTDNPQFKDPSNNDFTITNKTLRSRGFGGFIYTPVKSENEIGAAKSKRGGSHVTFQ